MTVFDPGLQPERTALAWRRTALALFAGSLVAMRVLPEVLGAWAAIIGLIGVTFAGILLWAIHHRYRTHHQLLTEHGDRTAIAGGFLIAATAVFCVLAAAATLTVVLTISISGHVFIVTG